jgi:cytochrome c biogenesis protein CcdA
MIPEKRFWLLRRLAKVLTVTAWIVLALVLLVTPVGIARGILAQNNVEIWDWIKYGVSGGLIFVNLLWIAQSIQVILAIEENTKQSTYVLEKLTTLTQQIRDRLAENAEDRPGPGSGGKM